MKKESSPKGRRHGQRARLSLEGRVAKTVVTFEKAAQVYCWSTDRCRERSPIKH